MATDTNPLLDPSTFVLHPRNAPLPRLQPFPVGSFARHESGDLLKITGLQGPDGRWTKDVDGDIGIVRTWTLTPTDDTF